jgi:hypothetical protein
MKRKTYRMKAVCPQCGCTELTVLSAEEMKKKYGDLPNIELECSECTLKYERKMKNACPEWAKDCKMEK